MSSAFHAALPPAATLSLLARVADLLPWPLLVLQPDAALVYANRAGRELLLRARPLRRGRQGAVGPTQPVQRPRFQQALARASAAGVDALVLPGRAQVYGARVQRLAGKGPVLLLLSLSRAGEHGGTDWTQTM